MSKIIIATVLTWVFTVAKLFKNRQYTVFKYSVMFLCVLLNHVHGREGRILDNEVQQ